MEEQAAGLAKRLNGDSRERIRQAYRILFGRAPSDEELRLGLAFAEKSGWNEYARVLLNANELEWVN